MKIVYAKQNIKQIWISGWYCFSCFTILTLTLTILILTLKCKYYKSVFNVYNVLL